VGERDERAAALLLVEAEVVASTGCSDVAAGVVRVQADESRTRSDATIPSTHFMVTSTTQDATRRESDATDAR
jgi:hypothetical protein